MRMQLTIALVMGCLVSGLPVHAQETETAAPRSEAVVPEGINERFKDPQLNLDEWLERFEVESRELYAARDAVLQACGIQQGEEIADIGAGTGFYSRLFAKRTGEHGWVYSVDIAPKFLQHIASRATAENIANLTPVLGTDTSVRLPPGSVDLIFVADAYHHFEKPSQMLASIYHALRPGGRFIVIDFERVPGLSRDWIIGHVRAGKDVFRDEIESAGFRYADEVEIEGFEENYLLRFVKPADRNN